MGEEVRQSCPAVREGRLVWPRSLISGIRRTLGGWALSNVALGSSGAQVEADVAPFAQTYLLRPAPATYAAACTAWWPAVAILRWPADVGAQRPFTTFERPPAHRAVGGVGSAVIERTVPRPATG